MPGTTAIPFYEVVDDPKPVSHLATQVSLNWPTVHNGPMGWTCPSCGYSFAPGFPSCTNCNRPDHQKFTTTSGVKVDPSSVLLETCGKCGCATIPGSPHTCIDWSEVALLTEVAVDSVEASRFGLWTLTQQADGAASLEWSAE